MNLQTRIQRTRKHFEKLITIHDCHVIIRMEDFHYTYAKLRLYLLNLTVDYWVLPALLHNIHSQKLQSLYIRVEILSP